MKTVKSGGKDKRMEMEDNTGGWVGGWWRTEDWRTILEKEREYRELEHRPNGQKWKENTSERQHWRTGIKKMRGQKDRTET